MIKQCGHYDTTIILAQCYKHDYNVPVAGGGPW